MAEITPPLFMDVDNVYSGDELGLPYRDLIGEGIVGANDLKVTERAAGVNLSVDVAAGACWVLGDTSAVSQPNYRCRSTGVVNLTITPDASNPRKVLILAQVTDAGFAGATRKWELTALHGVPAGSPVEPTVPDSAFVLALVDVTAGDTSIANSQITDRRTFAEIGSGNLSAGAEAFPVGSVYVAVVATNPATLLGYGTWTAFGTGRTLVGIDSGQTEFDTVEETGGFKTHTLLTTEIPSHTHTGSGGASTNAANGNFPVTKADTGTTWVTNATGGGGAHNNLQPYIVVYMWKRTA